MAEDDDLIPALEFTEEPEQPTEEDAQEEQVQAEETPQEPEPEPEKEEQTVPLAALQAARDEAKTLKARLAEFDDFKRKFEQSQQTQQQQPHPDLYQDPDAYRQALEQSFAAREANLIAEMSERFARTQNGDEAVDEALSAAQAAGVVDQFRGQRDPWGELVKWHKSQRALSEIGDDPAAYRARLEQELRAKIQAELTAESVTAAAQKGAPSLAASPNLGSRQQPAWSGPTPLDDILGN